MLNKVSKQDYVYVPKNPDLGFSPEHNKKVVEDTIKKYESNRAKKLLENEEAIKQRAEALQFFLKANQQGKVKSDIRKFFGKKLFADLSGKTKRESDPLVVMNQEGKILRKPN